VEATSGRCSGRGRRARRGERRWPRGSPVLRTSRAGTLRSEQPAAKPDGQVSRFQFGGVLGRLSYLGPGSRRWCAKAMTRTSSLLTK
jgi:hypothetical protein